MEAQRPSSQGRSTPRAARSSVSFTTECRARRKEARCPSPQNAERVAKKLGDWRPRPFREDSWHVRCRGAARCAPSRQDVNPHPVAAIVSQIAGFRRNETRAHAASAFPKWNFAKSLRPRTPKLNLTKCYLPRNISLVESTPRGRLPAAFFISTHCN
jgi:hypothetical protein